MLLKEWRYADRILCVDLAARTAAGVSTSLELKRDYVGGAGFVARLLADTPADTPAFAMASGPLSDQPAGRLAMGATPGAGGGGMALSSLGGQMAAALKSSGYDAVVLTGRLDSPAALILDADELVVLPAGDLQGLEVPAAQAALERRLGRGYASLILGPAAEHGVPFATLAHAEHYAGGSGVAAALGGMQIKALAVRDYAGVPSRCTGCTLACPGHSAPEAQRAGALGLDGPTAARLAALAKSCAEAGLLPAVAEPLEQIARRKGIGHLLADGEAVALSRLGPAAAQIVGQLPPAKRRGGMIGVADLLGTCRRVFRDRPGQVLRQALSATIGLTTSPT
ncbi:MAG TPA: aldehyde ferredoxin oxidoreductase N-terminal domain-containing protein [Symbiobacteriaceae bacterium]|jgi:aldehyde:ferredoxin oxidoreductase